MAEVMAYDDNGDVYLHLSKEEAGALLSVLHHVGGDPVTSPRKYIATLYVALDEFRRKNRTKIKMLGITSGSITFKEDAW